MKTLSVCVLLSVLSMVAFVGLSNALGGAGRPLTQMAATPPLAATPPSLNFPVGELALDAPASRPVPGESPDDSYLSARLAPYVSLHKAWNEGHPAPTASALNVCSD